MSYSTVYGLWPGKQKKAKLTELRNAWGMAPVVWDVIAQLYLGAKPYCWGQCMDRMWPLAEQADVLLVDRALLRMTFDTRYIVAKDVKRAIDDIAIFLHAHRGMIDSAHINHWPAYAEVLVTQWSSKPQAFGVHHTSVSVNPWAGPYNPKTEDYGPFDWKRAASVYEGLK